MAGSHKVCQAGQVLFKAGEPSDGMYIIRKGELRVYLEKDGKEVVLATIGDGGMIGEMALFDRQPRSASVKATRPTEVTHITVTDFDKLMKQIPKWFVGLMSALSGRLRTTNDRLQKMEAGVSSKSRPYSTTIRLLNMSDLLWSKHAEKDGKESLIQREILTENLVGVFGEDKEKVNIFFELLTKSGVMIQKVDSYKKAAFTITNRAFFQQFTQFITEYVKANPIVRFLPEPSQEIMQIAQELADKSPYESCTLSLEELEEAGRRQALDTTRWKVTLPVFKAVGDACKLVKTSGGAGIGLRIERKGLPTFIRYHKLLAMLHQNNLSS